MLTPPDTRKQRSEAAVGLILKQLQRGTRAIPRYRELPWTCSIGFGKNKPAGMGSIDQTEHGTYHAWWTFRLQIRFSGYQLGVRPFIYWSFFVSFPKSNTIKHHADLPKHTWCHQVWEIPRLSPPPLTHHCNTSCYDVSSPHNQYTFVVLHADIHQNTSSSIPRYTSLQVSNLLYSSAPKV